MSGYLWKDLRVNIVQISVISFCSANDVYEAGRFFMLWDSMQADGFLIFHEMMMMRDNNHL